MGSVLGPITVKIVMSKLQKRNLKQKVYEFKCIANEMVNAEKCQWRLREKEDKLGLLERMRDEIQE